MGHLVRGVEPLKMRFSQGHNAGDVREASRSYEVRFRRVIGRARFTLRDMTCAAVAPVAVKRTYPQTGVPPSGGAGSVYFRDTSCANSTALPGIDSIIRSST